MKDQQTGEYKTRGTRTREQSSDEGIAVLIRQVLACFGSSIYTDDMDALGFSLHHLFLRVDFLYRDALPGLEANTALRSLWAWNGTCLYKTLSSAASASGADSRQ